LTFLIICIPSHVLSTLALSSLLNCDISVANHVVIDLLTNSIVTAGYKRIKVGGSGADGVIVTGTSTPPLVETSITLTEAPLAVREGRTAPPAVVVVVIVVVVPGVVTQASIQQSVLHVSMVHSHCSNGSCGSQGCSTKESSSNTKSQSLLTESISSVFTNTLGKTGSIVGSITGRLVAVGVLGSVTTSITRNLGVHEPSATNGGSRLTVLGTTAAPLLLRVTGTASRSVG